MKFSEILKEKEYPAWKNYYLNYTELKELLYDGISKAPKITNAADTGHYDYIQYVHRFDHTFVKMVYHELDKVNKFYKEKIREYDTKFEEIKSDLDQLQSGADQEDPQAPVKSHFLKTLGKKSGKAEDMVEQAFADLYLEVVALSKYQELNYSGFRKILKKHDKLFGGDTGYKVLRDKVETSRFYVNKQTHKLLEEIETIVTTTFEKGSRAKAMKRLRVPQREENLGAWTAFKLGLMAGTILILFAVLAVSGQIQMQGRWRVIIRFFRGPAVVDLYVCLIGVNIYFWKQRGINHVYIFGINARDNLAHHEFWNIAAAFGLIWAVALVLFLNSSNVGIPVYSSPFFLLCIQCAFLFNPLPCLYWSSRKWLWKILIRCVFAPFHRVSFADFWMADQLSSVASLALDYQFMICFFIYDFPTALEVPEMLDERVCFSFQPIAVNHTLLLPGESTTARPPEGKHLKKRDCFCDSRRSLLRPLIRMCPSFIRMVQCIRRYYDTPLICPHLVNAMKYFMSIATTFASTMHALETDEGMKKKIFYVWIAVSITSSIYSYTWDIKMDWGLGNRRAKHPFLRSDLLYPSYWYYYAASMIDFVLRFLWAISLSLTEMGFVNSDIMLTITTPAEIVRRCMWNLFRLEHEQINNNNAQRLNRLQLIGSDASILATEEQQLKQLLFMMDSADGVTKHRVSPVVGSSSRLSITVSMKTIDRSKTELFTKDAEAEDGKTENSDASSNENIPQATFASKFATWCCCAKKTKNT